MTRSAFLVLSASVALSALAGSAAASQIDLTPFVDANLNSYFDGGAYPANGGPITIGGVGFNLNALAGGGTGIVQLAGGQPDSAVIPIGQFGVTTVYSIVNSAFGETPTDIGSLTFTGSGGATFEYDFIEGDNVRDHATTIYNTSAPNVFATADFAGGDRLDVQQIVLPTAFATQTLTSVTFNATDKGGGNPFLAALTTEGAPGVPEPETWALMLAGFGAVGYALRKRGPALRTA